MKKHYTLIPIAKDGFPVEQFGLKRTFTNFMRRLLHTHHYECRECWYNKQSIKQGVAKSSEVQTPNQ